MLLEITAKFGRLGGYFFMWMLFINVITLQMAMTKVKNSVHDISTTSRFREQDWPPTVYGTLCNTHYIRHFLFRQYSAICLKFALSADFRLFLNHFWLFRETSMIIPPLKNTYNLRQTAITNTYNRTHIYLLFSHIAFHSYY